jgi:hypothetical protein
MLYGRYQVLLVTLHTIDASSLSKLGLLSLLTLFRLSVDLYLFLHSNRSRVY